MTLPTYRFENTDTGETFEKWMYMAEKEPYLAENPHLKPLAPTQMNVGEVGDWANKLVKQEVGEWRDKLRKKAPGWNEVLTRASKMPGSNVKPIT